MIVIRGRNVQQILPESMHQLRVQGIERDSRNGPVIMFPEPVTTVYERPAERVMFWPEREANPFFHLIESLWMLAGMNDVETVAAIVNNMRNYSDDGVTFHGAYGYRWRYHFGFDQIPVIIDALKANKDCRRQVLSMWDARVDLGRQGKDLPCNLQAIFQIAPDGRLDMTVTNRSNDMVWGAYGANAVHFSYLHEFMARSIGVPQGIYRQFSANFHTYKEQLGKVAGLADVAYDGLTPRDLWAHDPYQNETVEPFPLMTVPMEEWMDDLSMFFSDPFAVGFRDPFFRRVAIPMYKALRAFKDVGDTERYDHALIELDAVKATDWQVAAVEWIMRRKAAAEERRKRAQDDGVAYD